MMTNDSHDDDDNSGKAMTVMKCGLIKFYLMQWPRMLGDGVGCLGRGMGSVHPFVIKN